MEILYYRKPKTEDFMHFIKKIINPAKVDVILRLSKGFCLDVGCGIGPYFPFFRARMLVGLDVNVKRLRKMKNEWENVCLIASDARYLPFRENTFDCMFAYEVIEHIPKKDWKRLIKEFKRVAKDQGHIVVSTPNHCTFFGRIYDVIFNRIFKSLKWQFLRKKPFIVYSNKLFDTDRFFATEKDLENLGFQVHGITTLLIIDEVAKSSPSMRKIALTIHKIFYNKPSFASHFLGILKVNK